MDEASGNALDSFAANDLTDNNTVGSGTGLVYSTARDFELDNTEYFSITDNTDLSAGDTDWMFEVWFRMESQPGTSYILSKLNNFFKEYELYYSTVIGLTMETEGFAAVWGGLSNATWYQAFFWHDSTANVIGIVVNAGTPVTSSTGGAAKPDTDGPFNIGRRAVSANNYWDGLVGPVRMWRRVLTSGERTELYNGGAGRDYAYIAGAAEPAIVHELGPNGVAGASRWDM